MKRFLRNVILYILCAGVIILAVNALYMKKDDTYTDQIEQYANMPDSIQISAFGGSHEAAGLNFSLLPEAYVCFNFANGQQFPVYDVRLMECFEDHFAEGGWALIGLTYFSLRHRPLAEMDYFESYNKRNYWILPNEYIYHYDLKTDVYVTRLPALSAGFDLFSVLFSGEKDAAEEEAAAEAYWNQTITPEEAKAAAENRYESYIAYHQGYLDRESVDAVYRMIEICRAHDITPVLITSPVIAEINDYIHEKDPAFFDLFYGDIEQICRDTGVQYFNYLEDERFVHDYSLFMDADHMNRKGAEAYTRVIAGEVLGIDY